MMWDPVHYLESCPSSDGACAVVFTDKKGGEAAAGAGRSPAWILGTAVRSEPSNFPGRDPVRPQAGIDCAADLYRQAGITDPMRQIDCAELYVPFSWYEPMWLEGHDIAAFGEGWKMVERGDTEIGGAFPVNMSGGVLSSNPIGASGLLRFAEAALQVRGMAGEHQVDGAKVALAQAYGAAAQYFSMWIVGSSLDSVN
jgi:acetyl-CoA C-acetyltransferase